MSSYEIASEIADRVNASNYDIDEILAVINLEPDEPEAPPTLTEQLLTSLGG